MAATARLIEIFSSIQGEGLHIGQPQTFLRLQGCAIACRWCDTPASFEQSPSFRVESPPRSKKFAEYPNPVTVPVLLEYLDPFGGETLSLTGGEPLEQSIFLGELLPALNRRRPVFLETAGVHPEALTSLIEWVDIVSMDLKLPSSTKIRSYWKEHEKFLRIAARKSVYCKVVLTSDTDPRELIRACQLIASVDATIPLVLQPVSNQFKSVAMESFQKTASDYLPSVRILPQLHKWAGWL